MDETTLIDEIMGVYKMAKDYLNSEEAKFINESLNKNEYKTRDKNKNKGDRER